MNDAGLGGQLGESDGCWKTRSSCSCQLCHGQGEAAGCGHHGEDGLGGAGGDCPGEIITGKCSLQMLSNAVWMLWML